MEFFFKNFNVYLRQCEIIGSLRILSEKYVLDELYSFVIQLYNYVIVFGKGIVIKLSLLKCLMY